MLIEALSDRISQSGWLSPLMVVRWVEFRAVAAILAGFFLVLVTARPVIRQLVKLKIGDQPEFRLFPEAAARDASAIDAVFWALTAMSLLFVVALFGLMAWFLVRYRAGSKANRTGQLQKTWTFEITWIVAIAVVARILEIAGFERATLAVLGLGAIVSAGLTMWHLASFRRFHRKQTE